MGLGDIGALLSCNRDGAFCEGYDTRLELTRTQTMSGRTATSATAGAHGTNNDRPAERPERSGRLHATAAGRGPRTRPRSSWADIDCPG